MYEAHFGLREAPFSLTPNTDYLVGLSSHQECLNLVRVALAQGEGFIKITGEVGTGKTLLCRELLNTLERERYQLAYIPNPDLTSAGLRRALAQELSIKAPARANSHDLLELINQRLIEIAQEERSTVLLIDESQALPAETLEAVRLLTNLETSRSKLLQVVLFGQPELDEVVAQHRFRQLRQRITFSYRLSPLDETQVKRYVTHRLSIAGYNGEELFDSSAYRLLSRGSGGIPRIINIVSHKALMVAYGRGDRRIGWDHVQRALQDTEGARPFRFWTRKHWLAIGLALLLLAGAVTIHTLQQADNTPKPTEAGAPHEPGE